MVKLLREKERRTAHKTLFDFTRFTAPIDYQWGWHHALIHRYLDDFAKGRRKRIIIEAPPRHGKSEATSRRLPAYLFGLDPSFKIALASHTLDLAEEMARDVKTILGSDSYQSVFPRTRMAQGGDSRDRADLFDIQGGGLFKAVGVGSGFTGRGFTHGIIDDYCKDRADANSSTKRDANWRWYTSVFHKRQARDAGILITATRWHEDDLIGRIKKKIASGESEPFDVLTLPALATDRLHPDDPRKPGEALWPWFRTAAQHEQNRKLEPRDFAALEMQDPRAEGGTEWDASLFAGKDLWFDDWPKNLTLLVIALDPSKGKHANHGDYSAYVILGRTPDGTLWVEADIQRRNVIKIVDDGFQIFKRIERETGNEVDAFGCESDQFQELLVSEFKRISQKDGIQIPMCGITTGGVAKEVRIRRLTTHFTSRNMRFRATPGTRLLVSQLEQFPIADHDDGPDALEMARRLANKLLQRRHDASKQRTR